MVLDIRRIERVERTYTVTAKDADGQPTTVDAIDVAVVAPYNAPLTGDTDWTTYAVVDGEFTVEYAGTETADQTGTVFLIPVGSAQAYMLEVDGRLADAEPLERLNVR